MTTKICNKCGVEKDFSEFHKKATGKFGLQPSCKTCVTALRSEFYSANAERLRQEKRDYRARHPEKNKEACRKHYENHKAERAESHREWQRKNPEKVKQRWAAFEAKRTPEQKREQRLRNYAKDPERYIKYTRRWQLRNPDAVRGIDARRRAAEMRAIPAWADHSEIRKVYRLAQKMSLVSPEPYHVDHIVPLRSKYVCGLHVADNLQILPKSVNLSKNNRHWPDMP